MFANDHRDVASISDVASATRLKLVGPDIGILATTDRSKMISAHADPSDEIIHRRSGR